jgi:hypothetical protein
VDGSLQEVYDDGELYPDVEPEVFDDRFASQSRCGGVSGGRAGASLVTY